MMKKVIIFFLAVSLTMTAYASEEDYQILTVENISVEVPSDWEFEVDEGYEDRTTKYYVNNDFYYLLEVYDTTALEDFNDDNFDGYDMMRSFAEWMDFTLGEDYNSYTEIASVDLSTYNITSLWTTVTSDDFGYENTDSLCYFLIDNTLGAVRLCVYHSYHSTITTELLGTMSHSLGSISKDGQPVYYSDDLSDTIENEELEAEPEATENYSEIEKELETEIQEETEDSQTDTVGVEYTDSSIIRIVQQALNEAGYDCGTVDGVAGSKTAEAIRSYEEDMNLIVNGVITDELLESLDVADSVAEIAENEAKKKEYSDQYTYTQLARSPDEYEGEKMTFAGKVLQTGNYLLNWNYVRLAIDSDYNQVIFVTYDEDIVPYNILEDDIITIYGTDFGDYTYTAVLGNSITIPWIHADIIDMSDVPM